MTDSRQYQNMEYRNIIINATKPIEYLDQYSDIGAFRWLAEQIGTGKKGLKYNSVDFIIARLLTRNESLINYQRKSQIDFYVIGTFRTEFIPIMKVAEAFAEFYLEMLVMPNIITISKRDFLFNLKYSLRKINNGIRIYDRERDLH